MAEDAAVDAGRFWRRRSCWVPTWPTVVLGLLLSVILMGVLIRGAEPFLAVTRPVAANTLVVEGWCEDYVLAAAWREYQSGAYTRLLVTGGPLDHGAPLSEYGTFAELAAAVLRRWAPEKTPIVAVPGPRVDRDRTYSNALALRQWFERQGGVPDRLNLVTAGAHARRSRLLFEAALGSGTSVGVVAVPDPHYDPKRWWRSSPGFRTVTGELIAYAYAITLFRPEPLPTVR